MTRQIPPDYLVKNRDSWNQRTAWHMSSPFYDMEGFLAGKSSLQGIEKSLLGNIAGKSALHLQCHFGQDTISLDRLGARATGVDLSDIAIAKAREIAAATGAKAEFICCDVYSLPEKLDGEFDIVFSSYGTIGWLPDLGRWGRVISRFLKPGGTFVFVEFHPFIWMFDTTLSRIDYSYFNHDTIEETLKGTYAAPDAPITHDTVSWNHPFAEVFMSLIGNGLVIKDFQEYDYSPYSCFAGLEADDQGRYRFTRHGRKIPMVYSIVAERLPKSEG